MPYTGYMRHNRVECLLLELVKRWSTPGPSLQQPYRQGYLLFPCASSWNLKVWILTWKLQPSQKDSCSRVDVDLFQWNVNENQQTQKEFRYSVSFLKEHQQWRTIWAGGWATQNTFAVTGWLSLQSRTLVNILMVNHHSLGLFPGWPLKRHFALLQLRVTDQWSNPDTDDLLMLRNSLKIFRT